MASVVFEALSKQFGPVRAVDRLSFEAQGGRVTGFLGPNGAGKTTALRSLLGLVRPTAGRALVGGRLYAQIDQPWRTVGAVLDAASANPGRTGRDHLRVIATAARVPASRVDETLDRVGLSDAAGRRVGGYSTGMRQRLSLAAALLGDPEVLVLDEPANGLDPEGIAWLRNLLRGFARDGRTVLVSSHVLSEVSQTVDEVVILSHGTLRFAGSLDALGDGSVTIRSASVERLAALLVERGCEVRTLSRDMLEARGCTAEEVGRLAAERQIALSGLSDAAASLEAEFLRLTGAEASSPRPAGAASRRITMG
ncbi:MAG: ATP-binding cassette domain-containing protein [Chloroflexota bacterium]